MILRRITHNMSGQNWTAISIEFVLVVLGVFLGIMAANWNEERLERRETERLLGQLQPEIQSFIEFFDASQAYYATTRAYAEVAAVAWEDSANVTDEQFVIAAYQASQIVGIATNVETWTLIFGADQLRNIDDPAIRRGVASVMATDYDLYDLEGMATRYRENVRRIIPDPIQQAIRQQCGDRTPPDKPLVVTLPRTCDLQIPADQARAAADSLRRNPALAEDLRWHLAAVATLLANAELFELQLRDLSKRIERLD